MKKLILLVIILITTLSANAETYFYKTSALAIDILDGKGYNSWKPCEVDITIDFDAQQVVIYSKETQVLDIEYSSTTEYKDYSVIGCIVNDTNYATCYLKIFVYNNGDIYFKMIYPYIVYKYKVKRYDN